MEKSYKKIGAKILFALLLVCFAAFAFCAFAGANDMRLPARAENASESDPGSSSAVPKPVLGSDRAAVTRGNAFQPTYFGSIEEAFSAANGWSTSAGIPVTVTLFANFMPGENAFTEKLTVEMGRNITLDLNGYILERETPPAADFITDVSGEGGEVIFVNGGRFTLADSWTTHEHAATGYPRGGVLTGGNNNFVDKFGDQTGLGGGIYAANVRYQADEFSGYETFPYSVDIAGGSVWGNRAFRYGAVFGEIGMGGSLSVSGGKIYENTSELTEQALFANQFVMTGGEISGGVGGGVKAYSSARIEGGKVFGNDGIGVTASSFAMTGGEIFGNAGSGVSASEGVTLSGGKIYGNGTSGEGGGIRMTATGSVETPAVFSMTGGEIFGNTAASGGGIYLGTVSEREIDFSLSGGKIYGNSAATGGGIYLGAGKGGGKISARVSGGEVMGNNASERAGGVYVRHGLSETDIVFTVGGNAKIIANVMGGTKAEGADVYTGEVRSNLLLGGYVSPYDGLNYSLEGTIAADFSGEIGVMTEILPASVTPVAALRLLGGAIEEEQTVKIDGRKGDEYRAIVASHPNGGTYIWASKPRTLGKEELNPKFSGTLYEGKSVRESVSVSVWAGKAEFAAEPAARGEKAYSFTFSPTDRRHYLPATYTQNFTAVGIREVNASFSPGSAIFTSTTFESVKNDIMFRAVYEDGTFRYLDRAEYAVALVSGETNFTAGENNVLARYEIPLATGGTYLYEIPFTIRAEAVVVARLGVNFSQGGIVLFSNETPESFKAKLAGLLTVTRYYNDGSSAPSENYILSGDWSKGGTVEITLTDPGAPGISAAFTAEVTKVALERLTVDFVQTGEVYPSMPLDALKAFLTVRGTNNDGSAYNGGEPISDYALSGSLTAGSSVLTVTVAGVSATFRAEVTAIALKSISAVLDGNANIHTTDTIEFGVKPFVTVTGTNNDGSDFGKIADFSVEGDISAAGEVSLTVRALGKETTLTVTVTETALKSLVVDFDVSGRTFYTSDSLEVLREHFTVTGTNADGSAYNGGAEILGYRLAGELVAGTSVVKVIFEGVSAEVNVPVAQRYVLVTTAGGEFGYDNLYAAFAAISDGTLTGTAFTVSLWQDMALTEGAVLSNMPRNWKITLDLNGYVIDRGLTEQTVNGYVLNFDATNYVEFRLTDSAPERTHADSSLPAGGVVTGGFNSGDGGGIRLSNFVTFYMDGGSVFGNTARYGGGIYGGKKIEISGGRIQENSATISGGGIYTGAELTVTGGIFTRNDADANGGGIYVWQGAQTVISGGEFSYNCTTTENPSFGKGGALNLSQNTLKLTGGRFFGNSALEGGALWLANASSSSNTEISGGEFFENTAEWGGALCFAERVLKITGGRFERNTAAYGGGGIYTHGSRLELSGGRISGNAVTAQAWGETPKSRPAQGGGVYAYRAVNIGGSAVVEGNTAGGAQSNLYLSQVGASLVGNIENGFTGSVGLSFQMPEAGPTAATGLRVMETNYFENPTVSWENLFADELSGVEYLFVKENVNSWEQYLFLYRKGETPMVHPVVTGQVYGNHSQSGDLNISVAAGDTPGTIVWTRTDQLLKVGVNTLAWEFMPADENFTRAQGSVQVNVQGAVGLRAEMTGRPEVYIGSKANDVSKYFDIYLVYADGTEIKGEYAPLVAIPESGDVFREGTNRIELTISSSQYYSQTGEKIKTVAYIDNVEIAPVEMTIVPRSGKEEDTLHYVFGSLEEAAQTLNERNDNYYDETAKIWLNRDIFPGTGMCFDLTEYTLTLDLKGHIVDFSRSKATAPGIYVGGNSWYEGTFTLEDSAPDAPHPERETGFPSGGVVTGAKYSALYIGDKIYGRMTGGTFYRNSAPARVVIDKDGESVEGAVGGAITIDSDIYFYFDGGNIRDNLAEGSGGGILAFSSLEVRGGEITGNRAMKSGGGIYAESGTLELLGGNISGNTADLSGGGVGVSPRPETGSGAKLRLGLAPTVQNNFVLANRVGGAYAGGIADNIRVDVSGDNYFQIYNTFRGEVGIRTEPIRQGETHILCTKPAGYSDTGKIILDDADCELTLKEIGENSVWYIGGVYAPSTVTPVFGTFYLGESLPEISLSSGDTPGSIAWESGQTVDAASKVYYWIFTPADTVNYNVRRGACLVTAYGVERIDVRFDAPEKLFTGTELDTLKQYLTVSAVFGGGQRTEMLAGTDYSLAFADGRAAFLPGRNEIEVRYSRDGKVLSATFVVEVLSVELESISVEFEQGNLEVYPSTQVEELKNILGGALKVNMHLTNGRTKPALDFTLSGTLVEGISKITVEIDGKRAEFDIMVSPVALAEFTVTADFGENVFRTDTAVPGDFLSFLSFAGRNNDGSEYIGNFEGVTLSFLPGVNWFEPETNILVATKNGISSTFEVYLTPYPVEVRFGETAKGFETLSDALAEIKNAGAGEFWVKLYQQFETTERMVVGRDQFVILDLNGRRLERKVAANPNSNIQAEVDGSVIYVEGALTVRDSNPDYGHGVSVPKGGLITGGRAINGGGIWVNGGTLILEGGTIYDNIAQPQWKGSSSSTEGHGSGVFVDNGGNFVMTGGAVSRNRANGYSSLGTGIYINNSTFEMSGGLVSGTSAQNAEKGGGIYARGTEENPALLRISGGEIEGNYASGYGAGISLWGNATLEFTGGKIHDNVTDFTGSGNAGYGGGVYVGSGAKFVMGGGEIYANRAQSDEGGGVYLDVGGTFEMTAGSIRENYANAYGGGVSASGVFRMSGGEIRGNQAGRAGGLYVGGGNSGGADVILSGGEIRYNSALTAGGGVYVGHYNGKLTLDGKPFVTDNCLNGSFQSTVGGYVSNTNSNIMYWTGSFIVEAGFAGQAGIGTDTAPTAGNPVKFGTGSAAGLFADNEKYGILLKDGALCLELLLPKPDITVSLGEGNTYRVGDPLSDVALTLGGSTPGSVSLGEGCILQGVTNYVWTFIPEDTGSFRVMTGSVKINAVQISALNSIFDPTGNEIFTSTAVASLKQYLSVSAAFSDGTSRVLTQTEISALALTVPGGALAAGQNTVGFVFAGFDSTFTVTAKGVELESISAVFDAGTATVYDSTTVQTLKGYLRVTGINNDGSPFRGGEPLGENEYSILGALIAGDSSLTAAFIWEEKRFTSVFTINGVVAMALEKIEITEKPVKTEYTAFEYFDGTGMVVTAFFNDGTSRVLGNGEYTVDVAGAPLENADESVSVSYQFRGVEKSAAFGIRVNRISVALPTLEAGTFVYDGTEKTAFTGNAELYRVEGHIGTLPGSYTAKFTLKDSDNYKWEDAFGGELVWTIAEGVLAVEKENDTVVYDGRAHTGTLTVSASDGNVPAVLYGTVAGEFTLSEMPTFIDAGDYTVYYRATLQYYGEVVGTFTVQINRADDIIAPDVFGTEWQTWTYGAEIRLPGFSAISGESVAVVWENGVEPENAGLYKLILTTSESKNYHAGRREFSVRIIKATYAPEEVPGVGVFSGVYDRNKTLADYQLPEFFRWENAETVPTVAVGEYVAYYNADSQNYEDYECRIAIQISKLEISAPGNPASKVYNGEILRAEISGNTDYAVFQNGGGRDAKNYDVLLRLTDPDNTRWASGTVLVDGNAKLSFAIEKAKLSVTIANQRSAQGKPILSLNEIPDAYRVIGTVFGGDSLGITLSTEANSERSGVSAILGSCSNSNYAVTFEPGEYEVYSIDGYLAFITAHGGTITLIPGEIAVGELSDIQSMFADYEKLKADDIAQLSAAQRQNIEALRLAAENIAVAKSTAEESLAALNGLTAQKLREGVFELDSIKTALGEAKKNAQAFLDASKGVSLGDLAEYDNIALSEKEIADFEEYLDFAGAFGDVFAKMPNKLVYSETADVLEMFEGFEGLSASQRAILYEEEQANIFALKDKADALISKKTAADSALGELKQAIAENADKKTVQTLKKHAEERTERFFEENGTAKDLPDYGELGNAENLISEYEQEEFAGQIQEGLGSLEIWTQEKIGALGIPELETAIEKTMSAIEKIDSSSEKTQEALAAEHRELTELAERLNEKLTLELAKRAAAAKLLAERDRVLSSSAYSGNSKREIESYYTAAIERIANADSLEEIVLFQATAVSDMNSVEPLHVGWLVADLMLAVILLGETTYLVIRRVKAKRKSEKTFSVAFPVGVLAVHAAGFKTGVAFFVILLVGVLALGFWIADLVLRERGGKNPLTPVTDRIRNIIGSLSETSEKGSSLSGGEMRAVESIPCGEIHSDGVIVRAEIAELIRDKITMREAREAISDEAAATLVVQTGNVPKAEQKAEQLPKGKRVIVNIDVLSANFGNGEKVTVENLKQKGLIPEGAVRLKVLARGALDKSLFVEADEFSLDAVKMIVLTGGKAIKL